MRSMRNFFMERRKWRPHSFSVSSGRLRAPRRRGCVPGPTIDSQHVLIRIPGRREVRCTGLGVHLSARGASASVARGGLPLSIVTRASAFSKSRGSLIPEPLSVPCAPQLVRTVVVARAVPAANISQCQRDHRGQHRESWHAHA
jgi:hypothetical protein